MALRGPRLLAAFAASIAVLHSGVPARAQGRAETGRTLAQRLCDLDLLLVLGRKIERDFS